MENPKGQLRQKEGVLVNRKPEREIQEKVRDLKQMAALIMIFFVSLFRSPDRGSEPIQECFVRKQEDESVKVIRVIAESELDICVHIAICKHLFVLFSQLSLSRIYFQV